MQKIRPTGTKAALLMVINDVAHGMAPTNTIVRWNYPCISGGIGYMDSELHHSTGDDTSLTKLMRIAAAFWAARS